MNDTLTQKALAVIAEAQVRMEQKIDVLLAELVKSPMPQLSFVGQMCPVCKQMVQYQIDIEAQVVKRACGCKTGKQPVFIPLVPVEQQGDTHGPAAGSAGGSAAGEEPSPDRPRRQGR